jgi:hypothetical protein
MQAWRRQKGELSPGCIVGVIVLGVMALIAIKTVPVMMRVYEFEDEIVRFADRANRRDYPPKRIQEKIFEAAERLRIPIPPEEIKVRKTKKYVTVEVEYDIEIDYGVYTYVWHKEHKEERPLF